eukprot:CAMPEP_0197501790 /NCGR_PEP_ID=MMETSP1312-20131121/1022_1 /TAXON_ID=464262 /ORGANISM="Genus nov. species nov., Strain RCC2335" /LENGTH=54 /DNA_ID=CAMNT_0043047831 /DNA_START=139 /DNA_END=299 /DNA_ORIENTATION=-
MNPVPLSRRVAGDCVRGDRSEGGGAEVAVAASSSMPDACLPWLEPSKVAFALCV